MKKIHKLALLPLMMLCAMAQARPLDLIMPEKNSDSELFKRPKLRMPQKQDVAAAQIDRLQANADFGEEVYNPNIELSALQKLALVKGSSSQEYLIEFVRYKIKLGGKNREDAKEAIDKLCAMGEDTYECIQGRALYEISTPQMRLKLQTFDMHEDHRNYADGVKFLHDLMGVPVEHALRFRYFKMLGNIEGSEHEAMKGLETLVSEIPTENRLKHQAKRLIITLNAMYLANRAVKNIDDPKNTASCQNDLMAALKLDPTNPDAPYWREILIYSRYYRFIESGDRALASNNPKASIGLYRQAAALDVKSPYAFVGLARAYAALGDQKMFAHFAKKAVEYSKYESASEQKRIYASLVAIKADIISGEAAKLAQKGDNKRAIELYVEAVKLDKTNPWNVYALASTLVDMGKNDEALKVFGTLPSSVRKTPGAAHAYSLILSKTGHTEEAYNRLKPYYHKGDSGIDSTVERLKTELDIKKAQDIFAQGRTEEAISIVENVNTPYAKALLGEFYEKSGDLDKAFASYSESLTLDNRQTYIRLKIAQLALQKGDEKLAYETAMQLKHTQLELSYDNQRALGALFEELNKDDEALAAYTAALNQTHNPVSQESAVSDSQNSDDSGSSDNTKTASADDAQTADSDSQTADASVDADNVQTAESDSQTADEQLIADENEIHESNLFTDSAEDNRTKAWMLRNVNNILKKRDADNETLLRNSRTALALLDNQKDLYADDRKYTSALRTPDEDDGDWLRRSLRADGAKQYLKDNVIITDGIEFVRDSGHSGYSKRRGFINVLNISFPLFNGHGEFQTDYTRINAGSLSGGAYDDMFGTCFVEGCSDTKKRERSGSSFAFAFENDYFRADIGTAPKISGNSFKNTGIVGGLSMYFDAGSWSFTPTVYRRVVENSLLSYFGDTDPATNVAWGAVKTNGAGITVSYYIDETQGVWFKNAFELIRGTNVENNSKLSAMGGYYYHYIDRPNERLTLAPSVLYMHYDKDLSDYTYGQGGYYSPQQYLSTSLALRYMRRYDNDSYMIEPSVSVSYAKKNGQSRYPLGSPVAGYTFDDINASSSGSSDFGFGGGIRASYEHRFTSNFVVGAELSAVHSQDYSPVTGMLYFRYYVKDWEGDLYMPPHGPTPYTRW